MKSIKVKYSFITDENLGLAKELRPSDHLFIDYVKPDELLNRIAAVKKDIVHELIKKLPDDDSGILGGPLNRNKIVLDIFTHDTTLQVVLGEEDELGTFVFRTTGYNSIRTLLSRLHYFSAVSNEQLATLPLALRIRAKSTTQSFRQAIYYVDITTRPEHSLSQAIAIATETNLQLQQSGFDQQALDQAARLGFANGEFEDSEEEGLEVVEEFYPDTQQTNINDTDHIVSSLSNKLNNTH